MLQNKTFWRCIWYFFSCQKNGFVDSFFSFVFLLELNCVFIFYSCIIFFHFVLLHIQLNVISIRLKTNAYKEVRACWKQFSFVIHFLFISFLSSFLFIPIYFYFLSIFLSCFPFSHFMLQNCNWLQRIFFFSIFFLNFPFFFLWTSKIEKWEKSWRSRREKLLNKKWKNVNSSNVNHNNFHCCIEIKVKKYLSLINNLIFIFIHTI